MHSALRLGYEGSARLARLGASLASLFPLSDAKALRALRARSGIIDRYRAWAGAHRDPSRPLLWMHAPSVGEGLQARPVLEVMRQRHPEVQLAFTHFSPSAETFARSLDVDFHDYLPFDSAADVRASLDALQPTALVYAKLDVWPTLSAVAHARGIRLGLVSATLASTSSRRSRLASLLLRDAYMALDAVGAIDDADAARLIDLGVQRSAITVTGDTRYDQVWQRAQRVDRHSPLLTRLASSRPTLVAGSTWPADEKVLLPAMARVRRQFPTARLIIAPHEPTSAHLASIEAWSAAEDYRLDRLDRGGATTDVILVDRVGVLGDLYALADFAFVGGGFHAAGLHSVLEPAAFGAPVLFGPRHQGSHDALLLVRDGGARAVIDLASLEQAMAHWLDYPAARAAAGAKARAFVSNGLGAAERSLRVVESLLDRMPKT
ncbi:MAG TPA: glycosyltransferase N-terminal domain-containing protein [Gemmatimonadaceae bacterium]|nr:glycosyltransferase N-terminal domain-containing protein [Gemmatimonadaceae bacterium]